MYWTSVGDGLPDENTFVDTWYCGERETDVKFEKGRFYIQVFDHEGDYDYSVEAKGVTHWMVMEEPEEINSLVAQRSALLKVIRATKDSLAYDVSNHYTTDRQHLIRNLERLLEAYKSEINNGST